jgi:nitroimidazol reductase NimA-like FMN-containing flavoprotein (pyridoxamine 5'-phosphate oxidase superfamily)
MQEDGIRILDSNRIMAISTVRADGWPQTTIVGYANAGLSIYFIIFRSSQKFANIQNDHRVSVAIGSEPKSLAETKAFYAGAEATELTDAAERERAWQLLMLRHPNLADYELPDPSQAVVMRAVCKYLSIVDYSKGFGYIENITADDVQPVGGTSTGSPKQPPVKTSDEKLDDGTE